MADAAGGVILELCKFIYAAAEAAKSHKQLSKRLKERVERLEQPLLQKVQRVPAFVHVAKKLLTDIHAFLKEHGKKKVIVRFINYQEITASFAEFRERLNELVADSQFVEAEVAQADVLQDELADFEAQQVINREMLDPSRAQAANKQLQCEAPREFTGFTEIDYDSLALGVELGSGSFGVVQKGTWSRMAVAVKVRHDRIVALYGACTVAPNFALVMEFAPSGTLYDLLHSSKDTHTQQRQSLSSAVRVQMLHDIAVAMQHLHQHSIVHGDVKTSNALVFEQQRVKICDFGLAAVNSSASVSSRTAVHSRGTPAYMAPEVLNGSAITAASDVYSYSMLIYEVITETVPFAGTAVQVLHYQLAHQKRPDVSNAVVRADCEQLRPLLQQCWQQAANKRPDFIRIVDDLNVLQGRPQQQQQVQQAARPVVDDRDTTRLLQTTIIQDTEQKATHSHDVVRNYKAVVAAAASINDITEPMTSWWSSKASTVVAQLQA
eukprot:14757-Heterococcus_DN1.PRE.1